MHRPDDHFPLDLSDFEYYAYRDETADHPMVMVLRWHISGTVDAEIFRTSLAEALTHHPLLRSVIVKSGRQLRWQLQGDHQPQLNCTFHDDDPPTNCRPAQIDLSRVPGGRFELRIGKQRSVLVSYLHHACVDGIGGIRFLADVFALYGRRTAVSEEERPEVQWPVADVLPKRGEIPRVGSASGSAKKWTEWLKGPSRFLLGKNYCIPDRDGQRPSDTDHENILHTAVLTRPVVRQLKRLAAARGVSTNDLCMLVYLQQVSQWTQADPAARDIDLLRILMPISMRTPEHDHISAANVLSYVFQPFRRRDCRNPRALLNAIHQRSSDMIHNNEGAVLLRLFSFTRRVPGLFWLSQKLQPSFATAVLANVGELRRVFGNRFPLKRGRVVAGNVLIQRIDGIAPLRKNTNVVISFGGYGGDIILNLRANPEVMSPAAARTFLDQVISRLTHLAETQSLTDVNGLEENGSQSRNSRNTPTRAV